MNLSVRLSLSQPPALSFFGVGANIFLNGTALSGSCRVSSFHKEPGRMRYLRQKIDLTLFARLIHYHFPLEWSCTLYSVMHHREVAV